MTNIISKTLYFFTCKMCQKEKSTRNLKQAEKETCRKCEKLEKEQEGQVSLFDALGVENSGDKGITSKTNA